MHLVLRLMENQAEAVKVLELIGCNELQFDCHLVELLELFFGEWPADLAQPLFGLGRGLWDLFVHQTHSSATRRKNAFVLWRLRLALCRPTMRALYAEALCCSSVALTSSGR